MAKCASKVVAQAKTWIGCKESDGTHKAIIDVYNSHKPLARGYAVKYDDQWCATFVSAVAVKLGYTDIMPTECSCYYMVELYKRLNAWLEDESVIPRPGWVLFYDWSDNGSGDNKGAPDHVGIVERVDGDKVTVIEGNYKNGVNRRVLSVNGKYIRGYGMPKYDLEVAPQPQAPEKKSVEELAREVLIGKWGVGAARKAALTEAGYDYNAVQAKVNELCSPKKPTKTVAEIAREVIDGKWGNGADRKKRLKTAGYDYAAVQKKVNELLK